MSALGTKLRTVEDDGLLLRCPGCKIVHQVKIGDGPGPRWTFNGNGDAPTFGPSILVRWPSGTPPVERVCHSFVRDGHMQFLADSTHKLAGETVEIPDWWPDDP